MREKYMKIIEVEVIRQTDTKFMFGVDGENRNEPKIMYLVDELMSECNNRNKDSMNGLLVKDVETDSTGNKLFLESDLLDVVSNLDDGIVMFKTTDNKVMIPAFEKLSESIKKGVGLVKRIGHPGAINGGDFISSVCYKTKGEVA